MRVSYQLGVYLLEQQFKEVMTGSGRIKMVAKVCSPCSFYQIFYIFLICDLFYDLRRHLINYTGSTGAVTDICCWGNESSRSVACVKWRDGTKNDYR